MALVQSDSSSQQNSRALSVAPAAVVLVLRSPRSVDRLIVGQLFHLGLGMTTDGSLKVCAVVM